MYILKEKKNQNTHQNDLSLGHEDLPFNAPFNELVSNFWLHRFCIEGA